MAEREENKNAKASKTAEPTPTPDDDDESSASEYEEIIEEVTDYSEDEEEEQEKQKKQEEPKEQKKSEKVIVTEKIEEHKTNNKELAVKSVTSTVDGKSEPEKGESLMPLLQDLLHTNMLQAKTAQNQSNNVKTQLKTDNTQTNNSSANQKMLSVKNQTTKIIKDPIRTTVTVTETAPTPTPTSANGQVSAGAATQATQVNRLSVPQKEDSGTESGEDLRLFAAGLREKFDAERDKNLIEEVTTALTRLQCSLREGKEIAVDANKRKSLLALVERLQTGLTSPEKLAELATVMADMDAQEMPSNENSSPENETQNTNRQRFAKRRNRNSRHTVGVSREELADARRYMEDMIMMENLSSCTTPDSGLNAVTPPQWSPPEKHTSSNDLSIPQAQLFRPNQFMSTSNLKTSRDVLRVESKKTGRRPLSGDYSVSFVPTAETNANYENQNTCNIDGQRNGRSVKNASPDTDLKIATNSAKRQMMKRANTIDIAKAKRFQSEQDTDSEFEDRGIAWGLKRGIEVSVNKKVRNVIPPFEPKTENDHKFLAFINKQSPKPGLGWVGSKSVSNWTNKFGNIKHNFEVGIAATATSGKPPPNPGHVHQHAAKNYWAKQQSTHNVSAPIETIDPRLQWMQQEAAERQRRQELERLERQRLEAEKFERQRQERERLRLEQEQIKREYLERERYARECYERERYERERLENERRELARLEQERLKQEKLERQRIDSELMAAAAKQNSFTEDVVSKPVPVNQFIHAPQSVFRPIENNELHAPPIYKPIPQNPNKNSTWQAALTKKKETPSPQLLHAKHSISTPYLNSPSPTATSPIGLPWLSKPSVDSSDFKSKASMFEERSLNDNAPPAVYLQRHNSLRAPKLIQRQREEYKKHPSLPNAVDPYVMLNNQYNSQQVYATYEQPNLPPPTNISYLYDNYKSKNNYKSVPCLPTAVNTSYGRLREDSLTNPAAMPLVLTSSNPLYSPQTYANTTKIINDYSSPFNSGSASPAVNHLQQTDYTDDDLESVNMTEYRVEAKVMGRPQGQTAITTTRRTNHMSDDELHTKNSAAAKSLLSTMKNIVGSSKAKKVENVVEKTVSPKICLSPDGRSYQAPILEPIFPQVTSFESKRAPLYKQHSLPNAETQKTSQTNKVSGNESNYKSTQQYISETKRGYVVSYPSDESLDSLSQSSVIYRKPPPPGSLALNRQRNVSENSTTSSTVSNNNLPSPGTHWTANPIAEPKIVQHTEQYEIVETDKAKVINKPEIAPKPQNIVQTTVKKSQAPVKTQDKPQLQELQQRKDAKPQVTLKIEKPASSIYNNVTNNVAQTTKNYQPVLGRKHSIEQAAFQTETNVDTKKSLAFIKQQKQIEQERRKSLGNIIDIKSEKSSYIATKEMAYKSSAPTDTPDLVKSSLPNDESMPILKKFGPPQRHHYVPNAYQSPISTNKKSSTTSSSTKLTSSTVIRREEVQHAAVRTKPIITETPSSPQPTEEYIPRNIVFNNISAFTSMSRRQDEERTATDAQNQMPRVNRLSKSDSWNQIVQQQQQQTNVLSSSPKFNGSSGELRRTKSGHSLAVPKMFEAGMDKQEIDEKQKTVAAYFSGNKSPNSQLEEKSIMKMKNKSAINRTKTSEKVSASRKSLTTMSSSVTTISNGSGLSRSATMPHIANLNLLDENNVEDAFEQLMSADKPKSQTETTTEKTESKGKDGSVVTTTTKVTTRTVTKPESPFNKFRQLDKQASQSSKSAPSTPTTPKGASASTSGSGVIFKFTDPALNARAATVKDQLLQWCQSKTQEYENVQITNFSSCWSDGLAFCALIHHFLPDAFDYNQLTPKNRRHNFQLAFNVADEKAGVAPLLDVDDMVMMKRPDWKCVFVYVQSIYRRFRNCQ